ncbi:uncharacterized protein At1g01500-like [Cynara cardunculus var. scolymus]|uniref:Erythronate-4-phosphate dehydrogenase family protein n=1 Tax=Cynara cardunculus var. scolymus TaxID=59895 RepID=A0A103YCG8_CYNCS|nr:uncharacterized protein At1g01500-like [Cynara cardunculus var. scolymus]XP_024969299.1 uncharacterized protein At1g01500-like [Cynara cardunculus var. scolymus]XP_024969300.1 uncharacterized protein At1g01500-like [Cynara cardunculus var. scolymus]XP_024969301.1 uncharacterized protein At1g01500-like [Cynara cardunculus var. scolymus]KVI06559.1 hypothetical protein Ccrd_015095 [Cynara cardunculus var. scolymus]
MEKDLYETLTKKDNMVANPGLQIIKHPSYHSYGKQLLSWFDIRVFYVRISNLMVDGYTPEYLTLNHIPLDPDTVLEVNGRRCTLQSEGSSCRLRRNRVDKKFEEATFVSTDNIRLSGSVKFEVFDGEDLILSGALEISNDCNGNIGESKDNDVGKWSMTCESLISASNRFLKGKQMVVCDSTPPMIEVYVAGSFSGTPIILTKTLQISLRKKQNRKGRLDTIPEYETAESQKDVAAGHDLQVAEYRRYKPVNDENYDSSLYWSQTEYMEGEDGALSWFNAGVRVGVGIGLGVCLGVGIGVGLLVRTYQSTTRNFRRRL